MGYVKNTYSFRSILIISHFLKWGFGLGFGLMLGLCEKYIFVVGNINYSSLFKMGFRVRVGSYARVMLRIHIR